MKRRISAASIMVCTALQRCMSLYPRLRNALPVTVQKMLLRTETRLYRMYRFCALGLGSCITEQVLTLGHIKLVEVGVVTAKIHSKTGRSFVMVHVPVFESWSEPVEVFVSRAMIAKLAKGSEVRIRHTYYPHIDRRRGKIVEVLSYDPIPDWRKRVKGMKRSTRSEDALIF